MKMKNEKEIVNSNSSKINEDNEEENNEENYINLIPITKLLINKNYKEILKSNPDDNIIIIQPKNNENKNNFININNNNYQNNNNNNFNINHISNNKPNIFNFINNADEEENNTRVVLKAFEPKSNSNNNIINNNSQVQISNNQNTNNNLNMDHNKNNYINNNNNNYNNNNYNTMNINNNYNFNSINSNRIFPNQIENSVNISNNYNNNINNFMNTNMNLNNNCMNYGNNLNITMPNYNNQMNLTTPINNFQNQNMINNSCFNYPMNNNNNFMNTMNFNNNMNNYNNQFLNNTNQINFNNNQINNFSNMQLPINNINNNYNFNLFNNGMLNFNNNYFLQCMQNMFFQQIFFKYLYQQYLFQYFLSQNNKFQIQQSPPIPQLEKEISNNKGLYQDLLDILREPNIQAKNDEEIINQFSSPDLMSNDLTTEIITEFLNLEPELLNGFGNKFKGNWAKNEFRGGIRYNPPIGWIGFGLNVINKYDNGNNDWLACDGREGEWCVGYHGIGRNQNSNEVRNMILSILKNNLQPGKAQACKHEIDINHRPNKVGVGVYCSSSINVLEEYAGYIIIRNKKYKVGIMVRCRRDKIRIPIYHKNYWVLDGNFDQLRPYRLLIKRVNNFF